MNSDKRTPEELRTAMASPQALRANSALALEQFGDMIPYGDPSWYQGYHSNYYNETHVALRAEVREWVEDEIMPFVDDWEEAGAIDPELFRSAGRRGYLAGGCGLPGYPTALTDVRIKSVPAEKFDPFHELVMVDEICRAGSGSVIWFLLGGFTIGLPPIYHHGKEALKKRILPGLLNGEKRVCLCITEPDAGSDVAGLKTSAVKTPDGKHYIVNGSKKWITCGLWSDYFTVAVRTGGPGNNGVSALLIERTMPGVSVRKMEVQGMRMSGSSYITFENVKVPVENLLGPENQGFKVIMENFNHERLTIIMQASRFSRVLYEEAIKHAHRRETFGKKLIDHAVIRAKLANMAVRTEAVQNWLETLVYQTQTMSEEEAMMRLGGPIAGCKALAAQTMEYCAREASQIFGGLAYTKGGQGGIVERLYREVRAYAIPGGSEEIMLDLSIRQNLKVHKKLGSPL